MQPFTGNGPSALILSYILHGHIPWYDRDHPHPDPLLHDKLKCRHHDLLTLDVDFLTDHFTASRFSYSTQALPVNVLLDTLIRPYGETEDAPKTTCVKWIHDPQRAVPHLVFGKTSTAGGQWEDNPVDASWDIGTLSYAGMLSLPGYTFEQHYAALHGQSMPVYLRPSRRSVADYFAAYPIKVGISESIQNAQVVSQVSRRGNAFYIGSHNISCQNLVLASGIFSELIQPPPILRPLATLPGFDACDENLPILVIGSGFSAADIIISSSERQRIIHVFKWAPSTLPSPLRACHQQAYPEYAGIYRRMKTAAVSHPSLSGKRAKVRHTHSDFDSSRDWSATYEGLPNAEIVHVEPSPRGCGATVTLQIGSDTPFKRQIGGFAYVVGRRGTMEYLSPDLVAQVLPPGSDTDKAQGRLISAHCLREKANEDLEVAENVLIVGSLTGDSLIRFAYGGCTYAAGKIMSQWQNRASTNGQTVTNGAVSSWPTEKPSRPQTPSSQIPAMSGLDGHEASPARSAPLDRRKEL